eukprot:gb/GFBE01048759.1/.p1 GENE.gb/GFBE01048759.1/~~gb/GFBE01048759.1/.p1  ORF type:complete len:568 (+),score=131.19 gb/GFBE01048759.1/:1-1704(+)
MGRSGGKHKEETASLSSASGKSKHKCKVKASSASASDAADASAAAKVIPFYSDKRGKKYREFSNFFSDAPPFQFMLPAFAWSESFPQSIQCEFSEKAIMATKAALMGDKEIFDEIETAKDPKSCKALGRGVRNFDQALWEQHLEETAFEVVKQKFQANKGLKQVLFSTGDAILVEAAPNDCIWGVGMGTTDDGIHDPTQWRGRNVLGYALMRARGNLRGDAAAPPSTPAAASTASQVQETAASRVPDVDPDETFLRPISDLDAVHSCYEKYGVVAVTGVLTPDECQAVIEEGLEPCLPEGCRMNDASSYDLADSVMNRFGVIGKKALFSPAILSARLHPNVAAAYATVHGRDDVVACHDRAAWMRPAVMNATWDTPFSWPGLHVDVSPLGYFSEDRSAADEFLSGVDYGGGDFHAENNVKHVSMGRTVQGVLNLYDNAEEDGGFQCVPGMFGKAFQSWVQEHPNLPPAEVNGKYELKGFGADAKVGQMAVRVPCPAGTLILFDATLPHGTKPNASANSRAILFLRYLTGDELPAEAWKTRNSALRRVTEQVGFEPDARQARLLYGPE